MQASHRGSKVDRDQSEHVFIASEHPNNTNKHGVALSRPSVAARDHQYIGDD